MASLNFGVTLSPEEKSVLLCFKFPSYKLCYPDCSIPKKSIYSSLKSLIFKQLVSHSQYYTLTKKGKSVWLFLKSI